MKIQEAVKNRILLLDGAFGTYFKSMHYNFENADYPEKATLEHEDWIVRIHKEYIMAGADIIRTNTFGINHGICQSREEMRILIEAAVAAAKKAVSESGREVYVAGSIGPIKYASEKEEEDAYEEYCYLIDTLYENGINIFVFETLSDIDMAQRLAAYVRNNIPEAFITVQFVFNKMGYTKYGYNLQRLVDRLSEDNNIDVFGINCGIGAAHMCELLEKVRFRKECKISVLPNAGYQQDLIGRDMYFHNAGYYMEYMKKMLEMGVNMIGGCCGTTPEYTKKMRTLLDEHPQVQEKKMASQEEKEQRITETNPFMEKLNRGEKVYVVELDSPFGKSADKFTEGAFLLKENQVDMVTISDSPMAKARADAFEMAIYVQNKTGLTMMPHIACRDRNAIAVHAAFLGAHINDIRNLLIITGDPVGREDRNVISPVFDFNSVKMMQYLKNMNEEIFQDEPFYYGGALNYAGANVNAILAKMQRKMDAGCSYFLTQPVYSDEDIQRVRYLKEMTGAKILCGIMPLVSLKNAKFMQNEMPGIHVPDEIVNRYTADMKREEAEKTAVDICIGIGQKMQDFADGYYIMTPFHRVTLVNKIIQGLRNTDAENGQD